MQMSVQILSKTHTHTITHANTLCCIQGCELKFTKKKLRFKGLCS